MKTIYTITNETTKYSVGDILKKELHYSRRMIIKLKKMGGITAHGKQIFTNCRLEPGSRLEITFPEAEHSENLVPENIPLDILYEDDYLLAVNKPRGLAVHPTLNYPSGTLANGVMHYYSNQNFVFRPVNRLDKDTSGIVLIAKNQVAAANLSKQLTEKSIEKNYVAILDKAPVPREGYVNAPIALSENSIIKRCVSKNGAPAETEYKTLKTFGKKALVQIQPKTGRTHQIRVHMAHIGCPLYADFLYGTEIPNETFYLHCTSLSFRHPFTNEKICIRCPAPAYFEIMCKK